MCKRITVNFSTLLFFLFLANIIILTGCSSSDDGGTSTSYAVYFEENCPVPEPSSVSFQATSSGGESGTADLVVTDVADVYAASLHLSFDPNLVTVSCTEGDFLNSDGSETELLVNSSTSGLLIIGITRKNVAYGVDAVGSKILLKLTFTAKNAAGTSTIGFSSNYLLDSSSPPQVIPNVSWCGGSVIVKSL